VQIALVIKTATSGGARPGELDSILQAQLTSAILLYVMPIRGQPRYLHRHLTDRFSNR
jgi:hypothetical protein